MPSAMKSTESANACSLGVPTRLKSQRNAAWPVPMPLLQKHDQQDERDERKVGDERLLHTDGHAHVVGLNDAENLDADRSDQHIPEGAVVVRIAPDRREKRRRGAPCALPRQPRGKRTGRPGAARSTNDVKS